MQLRYLTNMELIKEKINAEDVYLELLCYENPLILMDRIKKTEYYIIKIMEEMDKRRCGKFLIKVRIKKKRKKVVIDRLW